MTVALEGGEWSAERPSRTVPEMVPILQEAGRAPGPVWAGEKSHPHRNSIPDRPVRSESLYRLSYPVHNANEYQGYFLRGNGVRCVGLTPYHLYVTTA